MMHSEIASTSQIDTSFCWHVLYAVVTMVCARFFVGTLSYRFSVLIEFPAMLSHLCFQARMSDESQLAPHPRL